MESVLSFQHTCVYSFTPDEGLMEKIFGESRNESFDVKQKELYLKSQLLEAKMSSLTERDKTWTMPKFDFNMTSPMYTLKKSNRRLEALSFSEEKSASLPLANKSKRKPRMDVMDKKFYEEPQSAKVQSFPEISSDSHQSDGRVMNEQVGHGLGMNEQVGHGLGMNEQVGHRLGMNEQVGHRLVINEQVGQIKTMLMNEIKQSVKRIAPSALGGHKSLKAPQVIHAMATLKHSNSDLIHASMDEADEPSVKDVADKLLLASRNAPEFQSVLYKKDEFMADGSRAEHRDWMPCWVMLHGSVLTFYPAQVQSNFKTSLKTQLLNKLSKSKWGSLSNLSHSQTDLSKVAQESHKLSIDELKSLQDRPSNSYQVLNNSNVFDLT